MSARLSRPTTVGCGPVVVALRTHSKELLVGRLRASLERAKHAGNALSSAAILPEFLQRTLELSITSISDIRSGRRD